MFFLWTKFTFSSNQGKEYHWFWAGKYNYCQGVFPDYFVPGKQPVWIVRNVGGAGAALVQPPLSLPGCAGGTSADHGTESVHLHGKFWWHVPEAAFFDGNCSLARRPGKNVQGRSRYSFSCRQPLFHRWLWSCDWTTRPDEGIRGIYTWVHGALILIISWVHFFI